MNPSWLEIIAVVFNIAYVILAAREHIACWVFGIIGSALSIWLFVDAQLYAESVLFSYYIVMGFYGWWAWSKQKGKDQKPLEILESALKIHLKWIAVGYAGTFVLFWVLRSFTDAEMPLLDSFTTVFSFIATWMVAKRWIENWIYWIAIDALTVYLYFSRELDLYAWLCVAYTIIAVYGYVAWRKDLKTVSA